MKMTIDETENYCQKNFNASLTDFQGNFNNEFNIISLLVNYYVENDKMDKSYEFYFSK